MAQDIYHVSFATSETQYLSEGQVGDVPFTFSLNLDKPASEVLQTEWWLTGYGATPITLKEYASPSKPADVVSDRRGVVEFGIGEASKAVTIFFSSDTLNEPDEGFGLNFSGENTSPNLYIGEKAGFVGYLLNDDQSVNDTSRTPASAGYSLSSSGSSVNEGGIASFSLSTTNITPGTSVPYSIGGISSSDIGGQSLSGSVVVDSNGRATISIPVTADNLTEGTETLSVTVQNQSASVLINDTSRSVATPTYSLSASGSSVAEGSSAVFTLSTTNISPGSGVNYTIGGLSASDIVGGELSGSVVIGSDGTARLTIPLASDLLTEGIETLYVTVSNQTASMTVLDTSVSQISNSTTNNITNITNNITNINSGNTTTNITNNVNVTFQNSILNYDASVTNDSSVRQTVLGNVNQFEGSTINNIIVGTEGADRLFGYGGDDRFLSTAGDDVFDGGDGLDSITFEGSWRDFVLSGSGSNWTVRDTSSSGTNEGTDTLAGVERLGFADKAVALDIDGNAGKAYRVYKAAFARDPMQGDTGGLGYWIDAIDQGMDMVEVGSRFIDSTEFKGLYGTNPQDQDFLNSVYRNVLGREPDAGGLEWWINEMRTNPEKTYAKVLADFAESAENVTGTAQLVGQGIVYDPWTEGGGGGGGGGG